MRGRRRTHHVQRRRMTHVVFHGGPLDGVAALLPKCTDPSCENYRQIHAVTFMDEEDVIRGEYRVEGDATTQPVDLQWQPS